MRGKKNFVQTDRVSLLRRQMSKKTVSLLEERSIGTDKCGQLLLIIEKEREREREREREKERVAIVLMMWAVMAWVSQTRHVTPALHQNTAFGSQTLKVILEPRAVCNLSQF